MTPPEPGRRGPRRRSATAPADRTRRAEPARMAAFTLLRAVDDGAYANLELPRILRRSRLTPRDAAFATELGFGTIRFQGLYDAIIAHAADRDPARIDPDVLAVLRLGAHQLLAMRVAQHAAADQSVALARAVAGAGAVGFVNAVLRRISERDRDAWLEAVVPPGGGVDALAVRHSHPAWVISALRGALLGHGRATPETIDAELTAYLEADNRPPRVHLAIRPGLATIDELVQAAGADASGTSPIGAVLNSGDPGAIPAVGERRAVVQDEGSQHVALALAQAPREHEEPGRWLDVCAGPGGKAGILGALAAQRGIGFVANEVNPNRADLVRASVAPVEALAGELGTEFEVRTGDGREIGENEPAAYGRILVDAPCTGLGALRRRVEARWRRSPADLASLGPLQRDLLASALDAVAPGGLVAYATCSPHLAETVFVVKDTLARRRDVEALDARGLFTDAAGLPLPELGDGPYVQLWPHVHGTDAMFFALLRRNT